MKVSSADPQSPWQRGTNENSDFETVAGRSRKDEAALERGSPVQQHGLNVSLLPYPIRLWLSDLAAELTQI
ncbi:hypothetical protein GN299_12870 [Pseudomonas putida]|uniref:Uncharacterized protein n=1 Tax=Pseudomonas putida TaxID=303 RepID=A0A7V8EGU4_PSEPU|nr:hypothetical protein GN299_12870 [Pseudomonas putida]